MQTTKKAISKTICAKSAPWLIGLVLAAACMGAGSSSTSTAAGQNKFWFERDTKNPPVLQKNYQPLPSLSGLVKELRPAVVNIYTTQVIKPREQTRNSQPRTRRRFQDDFFADPFEHFERFFGIPRQREFRRNSLGSGFFISPEGYLLTNHHVVANASEIKIKMTDEREFEAKLIGTDAKTDIALIKVEPKNGEKLPHVYLGNSDKLEVGDWVIAIGNPFGLGHTVTAGIISGKDRIINQGPYDDFLQTDASINPGNSGGPLFDAYGNVVGVNTAIVAGASGVGFAVPINLAKQLIPQLRTTGKVSRGWMGISIQDLNEELAESFGIKSQSGVLVSQVFHNGPAAKAGIKPGDIILSINGENMTQMRELTSKVASLAPGSKANVEYLRSGKKRTTTMVLGEREEGEALAQGIEPRNRSSINLGLTLSPMTPDMAQRLGLDEKIQGLFVHEVDPASPSAQIVQPGDIILEVNRKRVKNLEDLNKALSKKRKKSNTLLRIQRGSAQLFVAIQP